MTVKALRKRLKLEDPEAEIGVGLFIGPGSPTVQPLDLEYPLVLGDRILFTASVTKEELRQLAQ